MSNKFNLDIIGEIADKNSEMIKDRKEIKLEDLVTIEQATIFIKEHDTKITNSWFNMSHALKKVRDEKLYKEKYETFEEYFENELDYKRAMVFRFLKIAESFPLNTKEEVIKLGVTKLINLSELDEETREEFFEENDVENMTAKDIKLNIKDSKKNNIQEHEGVDFSLTPDEYNKVQEVYKNFNKLNTIFEEVAIKNTQETPINYNTMYVLYDKMKKTKNEIRQVEKMLKKYI